MYRVKAGSKVLIEYIDGSRSYKEFNRDIDFRVKELIHSPLTEHQKKSTATKSPWSDFPWGFDVRLKWQDGADVAMVFAEEVHYLADGTPRDVRTVVVSGSGTNQYTLTLDDDDEAIKCSCPAYRFRSRGGRGCKHMEDWNWRKARPF